MYNRIIWKINEVYVMSIILIYSIIVSCVGILYICMIAIIYGSIITVTITCLHYSIT